MAAQFPMPPPYLLWVNKVHRFAQTGYLWGTWSHQMPKSHASFSWPKVALGLLGGIISQKTSRGAWHGKWSWGDKQLSTTSPDLTCPVQWEGWERARMTGSWDQLLCIPEWPHGAAGFKGWEMGLSYLVYLLHGPGVGGESWYIPKIADGSCLTGRFTAVHDPPASGVGLPPSTC